MNFGSRVGRDRWARRGPCADEALGGPSGPALPSQSSSPREQPMNIGILGGGKIGTTIATLLESCDFCGAVLLGDVRTRLKLAGLDKTGVHRVDANRPASLTSFVKRCDAVASAAPYFLNRRIAEAWQCACRRAAPRQAGNTR